MTTSVIDRSSALFKALLSQGEADEAGIEEQVREMRERVAEGEDPDEVLHEEGLEPDYFLDLL